MADAPHGKHGRGPLEDPSRAEEFDTFPFRPGDRVEVIYPDVMWDDEDREFNLVAGSQGTVTEIC